MNSKGHLIISILKSIIRIEGCIFVLAGSSPAIGFIYFLVAEVLGVFEELVDKR